MIFLFKIKIDLYFNFLILEIDILITHTPPLGHGDLCCSGVRAGCVELLSTVQKRVKPKYHVFGHVHEGMIYSKSKNNLVTYNLFYIFPKATVLHQTVK